MKRFLALAPLAFSALGTVAVLWRILKPGYVLTLDMVFGPRVLLPAYAGLSAASFPSSFLVYLLHLAFPGWLFEKLILAGLFFCLFYFPLRFYPFTNRYGERYFASVFFAVNPFVYERMLAGQWKVVAGYALLIPFLSFLVRYFRDPSRANALKTSLCLLLIGCFSLHILVMGAILAALALAFAPKRKRLLGALAILLLISAYWIVPYIRAGNIAVITSFSEAHWDAFRTAGDAHLGTLGNVAALYGFWGEHEYWVTQFRMPKAPPALWISLVTLLGILVIWGLVSGLAKKELRRATGFLVVAGLLAFIFSVGVGDSVFKNLNLWLFDHIWFWKGFRDTQKWSAVLAAVYVILAAYGLGDIAGLIKRQGVRRVKIAAYCLIAILYTWPIFFGFAGQLHAVEYPASWAEADAILKAAGPDCKVLFLPWHQYYSPNFNHRLLTANPARSYFHCQVLSGQNAELGDIDSTRIEDSSYARLETAVTSNKLAPAETLRTFRELGITYVIYTNDAEREDPYQYPFLSLKYFDLVLERPGLDMLRVR